MARKSSGYGAACYYAGKLVGRCTPADAQGYEQLMKSCGGNAARVLQEYAYFSPELRDILEKVAAVQAKESRTAGIFQSPRLSPWGDVQTSDTLCPGVFMVSTASHGGTMVALDMAAILSCVMPLLYVGIFSCGVGYTLQILAQKDSNPTVVTILLSLESVFAVIAGAIILKQQMSVREYIGCGVMFAAVILAQLEFPVKKKAE